MLMNPDMDNFMQKFFQANRLEEADVMNIEQLVRQYPFYAPLQYILAKKYRQVDNIQYKHQITKTAIFFSNPHWLNDLLLSDGIASSEDSFASAGVNAATEPGLDILPEQNDITQPEDNTEQIIDESPGIEYHEATDENGVPDDPEVAQPITEAEEERFLAEQEPVSEEPVQDLPTQTDIALHGEDSDQKIEQRLNIEPQELSDENGALHDIELAQPIPEDEKDHFLAEQNESVSQEHISSFNEEPVTGSSQAENNMEMLPDLTELKNTGEPNPEEEVPATDVNFQGSSETISSEPIVSDTAEPLFSPAQPEFPAQEIIPAELQEDISQEIIESFPEAVPEDEEATEKHAEFLEPGSGLPEQYEKGNDIAVVDASVEETASGSNSMDLEQAEEKDSSVSGPDMDGGKSNTVLEKTEVERPAGNLSVKFIKLVPSPPPDSGSLPLVPIEPLYAVDYFASQGIKLKEEDGKDKLSQKLRSFTEWLKTMKRIHPEKLEQEMDPQTSTVIQHIAEHSNELEDVVTEAMAEVYARQGLRNKAAEVYQKLSLLNPNKRAYFAARISKLNET